MNCEYSTGQIVQRHLKHLKFNHGPVSLPHTPQRALLLRYQQVVGFYAGEARATGTDISAAAVFEIDPLCRPSTSLQHPSMSAIRPDRRIIHLCPLVYQPSSIISWQRSGLGFKTRRSQFLRAHMEAGRAGPPPNMTLINLSTPDFRISAFRYRKCLEFSPFSHTDFLPSRTP